MTAIFLASIAVTLAVGGWAGIRYAQAAYELDADLTRYRLDPGLGMAGGRR